MFYIIIVLNIENNNMIPKDKLKNIFENTLKRINPDKKIIIQVDNIVKKINNSLRSLNIDAVCVKGGSIAKDTFLKGDHDSDLFVRFAEHQRGKNLSSMLETVLKKTFPKTHINRIHGSRDYFQFRINNIDYELVPVLMIHASNYKNAENVTDLSPEHVSWVEGYTKKNPGLKDDIRLAKQFCKANKIYGAESYINGLSGHIIDIMVIHYGSFLKLVGHFALLDKKYNDNNYNKNDKNNKNILDNNSINNNTNKKNKNKNRNNTEGLSAKKPLIIDHEKHLKNPLRDLSQSKISPLIIVDPIQADRNAAAALSLDKLQMFIRACKSFLDNPSEEYFTVKTFSLEESIQNAANIIIAHNSLHRKATRKNMSPKNRRQNSKDYILKTIILQGKTLDGSKDVVGTKALKVHEHIRDTLQANDFLILSEGWNFDFTKRESISFFIINYEDLSAQTERTGPPIKDIDACQKFKGKHLKTEIRGERLYATVDRKYTAPEILITNTINEWFIHSRIAGIKMDILYISRDGKIKKT
jgi:tRNA nucleotidyltransferase (CCA-adding enzyme)